MDKKTCRKCGGEKELRFFRIRHLRLGVGFDNICINCRSVADGAKLKVQLLEAFGGKCNCCGETHPQFLTLEHIHPVGHKRQKMQCRQMIRQARREGWDKTKYELLCYNCNCSKGLFGQCPHRLGLTAEQAMDILRKKSDGKVGYSYRKTAGEFKSGTDSRRTKGQFKNGFDGRRPSEQVVQ